MKLLAFDTCLDKTYVTVVNQNKIDNRVILSSGKNYHSAFLISTIVDILKSNNLTPQDLDFIATDIGPGSFTGIRACVTVARMLAQQLNIGVIGISSIKILSEILGGEDLVALDARKNKAYVYDKEILGAVDLEQVDELVKGRKLITDDSLIERFREVTKEVISYAQGDYPLGEILAKLAIKAVENGENTDWGALKPLYIQPPPVG